MTLPVSFENDISVVADAVVVDDWSIRLVLTSAAEIAAAAVVASVGVDEEMMAVILTSDPAEAKTRCINFHRKCENFFGSRRNC